MVGCDFARDGEAFFLDDDVVLYEVSFGLNVIANLIIAVHFFWF